MLFMQLSKKVFAVSLDSYYKSFVMLKLGLSIQAANKGLNMSIRPRGYKTFFVLKLVEHEI